MNKSAKKIIAIDCGKMNLKAKCGEREIFYKNAISNYNGDSGMLGNNTFNVEWEGKEYLVGERATTMMYGEGKDNDSHILSTLVAVTHFLDEDSVNEDVYLTYGESFAKYVNIEHKNNIKAKLEKRHRIKVGDKQYDFNIRTVHILPEGIGHILQEFELYQGMQYVVDIGGTTVNFLTVNDGLPVRELSTSFELGIHSIRGRVVKEMTEAGLPRMDDLIIDEYIRKGAKNEKVQKIINEAKLQQLRDLDGELSKYKIDIHGILMVEDVVFIGGTSQLLEKEIKDYYKGATVLPEGMLANVRGFYTYGLAKFAQLP